MSSAGFHDKPYDAPTLTKLTIFELYAQAWIPVFVSRPDPPFRELHIFDLFCGPGTDSIGVPGSPLRVLAQLREYQAHKMAGWDKVTIALHLSDANGAKVTQLRQIVGAPEWNIPGVSVDVSAIDFESALKHYHDILTNRRAAKLLIIDQFGVDAVNERVFQQLVEFPRTDFIFFLSSSTLNRFRNHRAIKIKIETPEDSYDVHRAAFDWYQKLAPADFFLGRFSIKKGSNVYGLIFGSHHPLGAHKFLEVAWKNDAIAGEANFDIERENVSPSEMLLPIDVFRPRKIQAFEADLEAELHRGTMKSELDLIHFGIRSGMTCRHITPVIQKLKDAGMIQCDFRTPDIRRVSAPRPIVLR